MVVVVLLGRRRGLGVRLAGLGGRVQEVVDKEAALGIGLVVGGGGVGAGGRGGKGRSYEAEDQKANGEQFHIVLCFFLRMNRLKCAGLFAEATLYMLLVCGGTIAFGHPRVIYTQTQFKL